MNLNQDKKIPEKRIKLFGLISGLVLIIIMAIQIFYPDDKSREEIAAEGYMNEMIRAVRIHCLENRIPVDTISDPSGTGLIGPEWSEIATTIGHIEAKRTSIQPEFAGLMVQLFKELDLQKGDTIAIGSSGSFPGLLLASLSAAKALDISTKTILSLGSSSFGATRPDLNIFTIYNILYCNKLINTPPVAVSMGGENDVGKGWGPDIISQLYQEIRQGGASYGSSSEQEIHLINCSTLFENVHERERIYDIGPGCGIKAFVNAGGAMANIGTSTSVLKMKPGIVKEFTIPPAEEQGMIHRALLNGIPVIHLLYLKGLAIEYGLKWDPVFKPNKH